MNIKTDRMIIRDFTMNDINDMQDILGDAETMKNCEPAYTIEKTADFLQKFCIEKKGAVAAIRKDTAKVIGYILFNEFNDCFAGFISEPLSPESPVEKPSDFIYAVLYSWVLYSLTDKS